MGSTSPKESNDKKEIEYYNENGIIHNPKPQQISTIPIPLLLLSLIKIKEIKTFLQENQENIETNGKVKLLKILCNLNKSTKLINDYVNIFEQEFSVYIKDLNGLLLYDFVLKQLHSELQNFENKIGNISITELFYFNISGTCKICKNWKNTDFILMLNTNMLDSDSIQMDLYCEKCKNKTDHLIRKNNKPKIIISFNEDLENSRSFEMMMKNQYESICQIYSKSLVYKNFNNYYQYELESNTYKKTIKTENNSIVYIYREIPGNIESENIQNNQAIMSFLMNKNYSQAIMNYLMIKKNNLIGGKMFLVNKEYFDYLLIMNDIDTTNIDSNNFMSLEEKIQSNRLEIMNMNKLIIYDEPEKIIGDVDFVTEDILKNLGFKANEYLNKEVQILKNAQNQLYQILFHNNSKIKLIIQGNQQKIYLLDKLAIQTLGNLNQNLNNANQQREIQAKTINDNQNNNINNVNNVNNVDSKEDKKEKELKDKMVLIYSSIAKLFINIDSIKNLINNHIVDENQFEEYLIISKRSYNLITKIFESDDVYHNENIVFSNISHMSNIPTLQKNDLVQRYNLFENRKNLLKKENLLNLDYGRTKTAEEIIAYPKDFILIKEKNLEELLSKLNIKIKTANQVYKMILGEGYAFIKDNKTKKNIIFVCKNDNNMVFQVEFLLQYDKDDEFTKEIKKIIKNKGFENYFKERNINLSKKSQDLINKEAEKIGKFEIVLNSNPLIRGLFYSLSNIKNINSYFKPLNNQANVLSYLFSSYIKNNNQNLIQMNKIILETEEKLKELSNQNLNTFNFKTLIKFVLNSLDNELNTKRRDININIEGYDQSFAFNKFKDLVNKQNDSIIYKLFYGTIKITCKYQTCQIENYSHKLFKYLHFKIEKDSPTDINALIESYKSRDKKGKGDCENCAKKGEDYIKHKEILIYPEILIIIIDNENNINIDTKLTLKLKDEDFILLSCIAKSENIDDYNIIYQANSKYFIYDGNEKKEVGQELSDYIKNPYVLFYKKQKKDDPSCIAEKDEEYEEDIHDSVPTFLKNQMDENNENNIDNINNDNSITKMMIQKSFNENQMNNIKTSIHDTKIIQNGDNQNFNNNNMNSNENNMNNMNKSNNLPNNMNNNMNKAQNIHKSFNPPKPNNQMNWNNNMNLMDMNNVNQKKISQSMNQFNMPNFNKQMNSQNNNQMNLFNNMNSNNQMNNANMNQFNNINPQMNGNNMNNNMMNPNNMNNMMNNNNMNNMMNNNMNNMMNNMNNNNWNNKMNNINNNNFNNNNMNNMNNFNNNNMNNMNIISNNNMNNNMMNNNFKNNMNNNNNWNNNSMMNQFNQNGFNIFNNNNNPMIMNNNMQNNNAFQMNNNQNPNRFVNQNNNNIMLNNNQQISQNNFAQNQNQRPMPVSNPINNQNNQNNNINMNINNSANNQMMDNDNESENQNDNILSKNEGEITIYFDFKNGKQIYIDVNVKTIFREVINQLKEKYEWLNNINIKCFLYNGRTVDINKTCEENNIAESAKISIIDE